MVLEVVGAEQDAGHLDGVARALGRGDRAHERLVAVAHVRIDHVEVALVDRHVDRLADRAARVMEVRGEVGQLHEVAEVLDRAVAPAAVEVAHERRAVVGREDRVHPADLDVAFRVARVLGELAWRGRLDDLAAHAPREADPLALDIGTGVAEQAEGVGVAAELEADLLEDRVRVVLDEREALLVEHLERGELPGQERDVLGVGQRGARPVARHVRRCGVAGVSSITDPPCRPGCRPWPRAGAAALRARPRQRRPVPTAAAGSRLPTGVDTTRSCGERHRLDEVLLEARLDGGLDLLDLADDAFDLVAGPRPTAARSARRSRPHSRPAPRGRDRNRG